MLKAFTIVMLSSFFAVACATAPATQDVLRIDATSTDSAEASYKAMMSERSEADQQRLALAVLMLNMEGVESAREVVDNPELQSPSIGRIKDKVAGLSANEIIELAARNPSIQIETPGQ
ncbi:hypothetical protein [Luteimonas vadosa]|uniref:Uncharacterized protein n=1 Tax=Luteimonas vadosa TaxID=1165507 RepID=A0ABP9DVL4_9GAMM